MHLLINTATTFKGGGIQVAKSFIEECQYFTHNQYTVVLGAELSGLIEQQSFPNNFKFFTIPYRPSRRVFSLKDPAEFLKAIEQKLKPDVIFTTSGPAYWQSNIPHLIGYNLPHYIYSESPFFNNISLLNRIRWKLKGQVIKYFFKRDADAYVVQTEDVNQRLREWLQVEKVYTVSNTVGSQYHQSVNKHFPLLKERKADVFRILVFSGYYRHKNIEILNGVIAQLKRKNIYNIQFILTLPEPDFYRTISLKNRDFTINVGSVNPNQGPLLYQACDAVFLPTLMECFSVTYAEALIMLKPIITTDMGFSRTLCGNAALYFKPLNAADATDKILKLYKNQPLIDELITEGLSLQKKFINARQRAAAFLEICEELAFSKHEMEPK